MSSLRTIPSALLSETKDQVFNLIQQNQDKVDPLDVTALQNGSNLIERCILDYLEAHVMTDGITSMSSKISSIVLDSLKWRKEFGINHIKDSDLPIEFYNSKLFEVTSKPNGSTLIIMNVAILTRMRQWSDIWIKFIVHEMEREAQRLWANPDFFDTSRAHVLVDSSKIGICHVDLHFIMTIVPIFLKHFPQGFEMIWLYGLPLFTRHIKSLMLRSLPARIAKKVTFTDKQSIIDDMGQDVVPVRYGGTNDRPIRDLYSETASNLSEVGRKNGFSESEISKMISEMASLNSNFNP